MPLYFGVFVSLFAYLIGMELKKKFGWPVLNPLLVAIILVIAFLKATGITYTDYNEGASYISYFLTPATVCLAIPLYKQLELLKRNLTAVATAITAGVIGSVVSVYVMSMIFKLESVSKFSRSRTSRIFDWSYRISISMCLKQWHFFPSVYPVSLQSGQV